MRRYEHALVAYASMYSFLLQNGRMKLSRNFHFRVKISSWNYFIRARFQIKFTNDYMSLPVRILLICFASPTAINPPWKRLVKRGLTQIKRNPNVECWTKKTRIPFAFFFVCVFIIFFSPASSSLFFFSLSLLLFWYSYTILLYIAMTTFELQKS